MTNINGNITPTFLQIFDIFTKIFTKVGRKVGLVSMYSELDNVLKMVF